MEKLDAQFEEKTSKLSAMLNFQKEGTVLMEIDGRDEVTDENMADGEVENLDEDEEYVEQFKIVHHKKGPIRVMLRSSDGVGDKNAKILEKATNKKEKDLKGTMSSHSIFNSFDHLHFVSFASASGIVLGNESVIENEVVDILMAKEKAQTVLSEARLRREEEERKSKEKNLQIISLECDKGNDDLEEERDNETCHEEGTSFVSSQVSGKGRKPRNVVRKKRVGNSVKKKS
jgi:hypothetical protein